MNTFGVDFHEHLAVTKKLIPIIVTKCINEIDERGMFFNSYSVHLFAVRMYIYPYVRMPIMNIIKTRSQKITLSV